MNQEGFSLTEVLVSVLVLAIGIVGAAGMQLTALRTSRQSMRQSVASELATEMADRIRASGAVLKSGDGDSPFAGIDYSASAEPVATSMDCQGSRASCDLSQMARFEIHEWEQRLKTALPKARAKICRDANPWDSAMRSYKWECDSSTAISGAASLVVKIGWPTEIPASLVSGRDDRRFAPALVLAVEEGGR